MADENKDNNNEADASESTDVVVTPAPSNTDDDQAEPIEAKASTADRTSGSGGSRLLSGVAVLFSLVAVVGLAAIFFGVIKIPGPSIVGSEDLNPKIAALQTKVADLEAQLTDVRQQVQMASTSDAGNLAQELQEMDDRIQTMAQQFAAQAVIGPSDSVASSPEASEAIAALRNRLQQIESDKGSVTTIADADIEALQEQVKGFRQSMSTMTDRFDSLNRGIVASDVRLDQLEENAPPEDLDQILSSLTPRKDVDFLVSRLERLEQFNTIEAARSAVTAMAAAELARATRGSDPFVKELDAFSTVAPGDPSARELRSFAVSGVATNATLSATFGNVVEQAIEAEKRANHTSWLGNLWASFLTLFDVRPVGEIEGDGTKAVIARAEQRVVNGDLHAAALELKNLGGAAADSASTWIASVNERDRVDRLVVALTARVFSSLDEALEAAPEEG